MEVGEKLKNLDQMKTVSEEQLFVELTELSLGEILSEPFWQAAFQKLFRLAIPKIEFTYSNDELLRRN